jgi:hypothetical protein
MMKMMMNKLLIQVEILLEKKQIESEGSGEIMI